MRIRRAAVGWLSTTCTADAGVPRNDFPKFLRAGRGHSIGPLFHVHFASTSSIVSRTRRFVLKSHVAHKAG